MLGRRDEMGSVAVLPLAVGGRPGVELTGVEVFEKERQLPGTYGVGGPLVDREELVRVRRAG